MPIEVDVAQRLDEVARATIAVAARRGASGVTIRRVAAELGGSTTLVTNYVASRGALLANAIAYMLRNWEASREEALAGVDDADRLLALARWSCTADADDIVFRHLLIEVVARPEALGGVTPFVPDAREHRDDLEERAAEAGMPAPAMAADALFLLIRGFHYASVEDGDQWGSERISSILDGVVALLRHQRHTTPI